MKIYNLLKTEIHPHEFGTHICVRDEIGTMLGEINVNRKRGVDSLELKGAMKALLKENETFSDLAIRATEMLPKYAEVLEIRYIF
jgi:hypothetical protein